MASGHGFGQQAASQLTGCDGGNRLREEKPNMGPAAGAGALHRRRYANRKAGFPEGRNILLPAFFVKVSRQQPGAVILQYRIDPYNIPAEGIFTDKM